MSERHRSGSGASTLEYALLISSVAAIPVIVLITLGGVMLSNFTGACNSVNKAGQPMSC